jgi:hypothetical protein
MAATAKKHQSNATTNVQESEVEQSSINVPHKQSDMVFTSEVLITSDTVKIAEQHAKYVQMANDLIAKGTQAEVKKAVDFLDDIESAFALAKERETLDELIEKANPYEAAYLKFIFVCIGHKVEHPKDSKDISNVISTNKTNRIRPISLSRLAARGAGKLSTDWKPYVEKFAQLVAIRHAENVGCTPERIKELSTSYVMTQTAKALEIGKTPTSNTQMCKQLQQVIDKLIWKSIEGKNENGYRVNNYDVAFIEDTFAKASRKVAANLILSTPRDVEALLLHVMHRLVVDGKYDFTARLKTSK